ncbi:MAG TPA: alpha/beta hydrolase [Rhodanobacteraceae bacterium]|nr:alpha/beta hydrolase [Rhodanobacteraceae bacterium]
MATFILIPGAGGVAWYWHRVVALLEDAGHRAIAVDLPGDDENAGLATYAKLVADAAHGHRDVVLVAQSLGGFTAPLACERMHVARLVFVNAMIPRPGETAGAWWENTGATTARLEAAERGGYGEAVNLKTYFFHDVPADVLAEGKNLQRNEAEIAFAEPCRFASWPAIPIHAIAGEDDRFFPPSFQHRVAAERLGIVAEGLPGGHLIALSRPRELADRLLSYLSET